jgi:hypothetical protein
MSTVSIGQNRVKNVEILWKRGYALDFFVNYWFSPIHDFPVAAYRWTREGWTA